MSIVTSEAPAVIVTIDDSVGILELARPQVFNALSSRMHQELLQGMRRFEEDPRVRSVLLHTRGYNFCTGADLEEVKAIRGSRERLAAFLETGHETMLAIEQSPLPVVAAAQGLTLAGGLELLLSVDIAFAAKSARFGDQHGQFGLVPGWGGSQRLPKAIGLRRSLDLLLGVRWIDAETARDWGLVNYVVADDGLTEEALTFCRTLATRSRAGLATMKRLARAGIDLDLKDGLRLETKVAGDALEHGDATEGLSAFESRRKPRFI